MGLVFNETNVKENQIIQNFHQWTILLAVLVILTCFCVVLLFCFHLFKLFTDISDYYLWKVRLKKLTLLYVINLWWLKSFIYSKFLYMYCNT